MDLSRPHRRYNPLRGEWILVSPQRTQRPWQGETSAPVPPPTLAYDPTCYLCPGNSRAGGARTPVYPGVYAFDNDYPALLPEASTAEPVSDGSLLIAEPESGRCRVICFDPNHSLTLPNMPVVSIVDVIKTWADETSILGADPSINYVSVFENRGAMMGSSNPHPHCQIWATAHIPNEPAAEGRRQLKHFQQHHRTLLADYLDQELTLQTRIVFQSLHFVVLVPFWAIWPFETIILPRAPMRSFTDIGNRSEDLAHTLKQITSAYDRLFDVSFPYTMGFHQNPTDGAPHPEWTFHAHFYPPLLRSAEIRKFMVGFEMLGMPQRDITPEKAADMLRSANTAPSEKR